MTTPLRPNTDSENAGVRAAAAITMIVGLWYIASAWVYGSADTTPASMWNNIIVGILIAAFAVMRLKNRAPVPTARWLDLLFGIWAFCSPWIFSYVGNEGRLVNSVCVGLVVFVSSLWAPTPPPTVVRPR